MVKGGKQISEHYDLIFARKLNLFFQDVLLHSPPVPGRPFDGLPDLAAGGRVDLHQPLLLRRLGALQDGQVRADDRALPQLVCPHHDSC